MAQKMGAEIDQFADSNRADHESAARSVLHFSFWVSARQLIRMSPSAPSRAFAPIEKNQYRGELVFVDHVNRRGSVRVAGNGQYSKNDPHPIAMLPYGMVRYHGAPADLRDIPLGTMLHVYGFLPPDPKISSVPVLPVDNKEKDAKGRRGTGIFPAENHVLILEDEPSHCLRNGLVWKLKELEINHQQGLIVASREPESGASEKTVEESMTSMPPPESGEAKSTSASPT